MTKKLEPRTRTGEPRTVRVERARPDRYRTFLKRLRAGGRSNMYGAIPYLMDAFSLDRTEAFRIVCEWVDQQRDAGGTPRAEASAAR